MSVLLLMPPMAWTSPIVSPGGLHLGLARCPPHVVAMAREEHEEEDWALRRDRFLCLRGLTEDVEETHDLMLALLEREREAKALLTSLQYKSFRALSSAEATIAAEQIGGRALLREYANTAMYSKYDKAATGTGGGQNEATRASFERDLEAVLAKVEDTNKALSAFDNRYKATFLTVTVLTKFATADAEAHRMLSDDQDANDP